MDGFRAQDRGTLLVVDWQDACQASLEAWQKAVGPAMVRWTVWNIWSPLRAGRKWPVPAGVPQHTPPPTPATPTAQGAALVAPRGRLARLGSYLRAAWWVAREGHRYERVVVWQQWIGLLACLIPGRRGYPRTRLVVTTLLIGPARAGKPGLETALLGLALRRADALVYFSTVLADAVRRAWPHAARKVHAMPMPVMRPQAGRDEHGRASEPDTSITDCTRPERPAATAPGERADTTRRRPRIFAGGRSERDFDVVIEAFEGSDVQLTLVCDRKVALRRPCGGSADIQVHRDVDAQRFEALALQSDIVVVALRSETSPCGQLLLTFCMQERLALVVTDAAGTRDYVVDGRTGLTVPAGDPKALRHACERLARDDALRRRLVDNAQTFVQTLGFAAFARSVDALPTPGR